MDFMFRFVDIVTTATFVSVIGIPSKFLQYHIQRGVFLSILPFQTLVLAVSHEMYIESQTFAPFDSRAVVLSTTVVVPAYASRRSSLLGPIHHLKER